MIIVLGKNLQHFPSHANTVQGNGQKVDNDDIVCWHRKKTNFYATPSNYKSHFYRCTKKCNFRKGA